MAETVSTFEQFIKFSTDAYGIERLLRALQALTTLLLFTPSLHHLLLLPFPNTLTSTLTNPSTLTLLRTRLATLRQSLRFFRFLDSFAAAWAVLNTIQSDATNEQGQRQEKKQTKKRPVWGVKLERWMDFGGMAFTGMYLLLESLVFVEVVLDVPGLGIWGSQERVAGLVVDGQRFWFLGLLCGVVGGWVRYCGWDRAGVEEENGEVRVEERVKRRDLGRRRLLADVLDLAIPGTVVGWVSMSPEKVGLCMLVTSILTGMDVWERCGREIAASKAAARAGR